MHHCESQGSVFAQATPLGSEPSSNLSGFGSGAFMPAEPISPTRSGSSTSSPSRSNSGNASPFASPSGWAFFPWTHVGKADQLALLQYCICLRHTGINKRLR